MLTAKENTWMGNLISVFMFLKANTRKVSFESCTISKKPNMLTFKDKLKKRKI